ncbi:hypothetical protein Tco_1063155 [Tanacetum coccineum]
MKLIKILIQHDAEIQGRHRQEIEFETEVYTAEDVSTAGASISTVSPPRVATAEDISTTATLVYIRRSAAKDKGKAKMDESEPEQTKINLQQRQERAGYEAARIGSHALQQLKRLSFDELKNSFEATMRRVGAFVPMETKIKREVLELAVGSSKRDAKEELDQWSSKRQKTDSRMYWKIIRVGNHTEVYQIFEDMLKSFDRNDLVKLWSLVQERFNSTDPTEDKEIELWVELERLFEPDVDDELEVL